LYEKGGTFNDMVGQSLNIPDVWWDHPDRPLPNGSTNVFYKVVAFVPPRGPKAVPSFTVAKAEGGETWFGVFYFNIHTHTYWPHTHTRHVTLEEMKKLLPPRTIDKRAFDLVQGFEDTSVHLTIPGDTTSLLSPFVDGVHPWVTLAAAEAPPAVEGGLLFDVCNTVAPSDELETKLASCGGSQSLMDFMSAPISEEEAGPIVIPSACGAQGYYVIFFPHIYV
jgi:hypothetical protein